LSTPAPLVQKSRVSERSRSLAPTALGHEVGTPCSCRPRGSLPEPACIRRQRVAETCSDIDRNARLASARVRIPPRSSRVPRYRPLLSTILLLSQVSPEDLCDPDAAGEGDSGRCARGSECDEGR